MECLETKSFPYLAIESAIKLSPSQSDSLEYEIIKLAIPGFDREAEFDSLTPGETKDVIDAMTYITNSSRMLNS